MKDLAQEAKKRLKGGYWTNYLESRDADIKIARASGVSEDVVTRAYRGRARAEIKEASCEAERVLYDKVRGLMSTSEIVTDPIGRLIDEQRLSVMGKEDGERYILELASAYVRIKRKIEEEERYNRLIGG